MQHLIYNHYAPKNVKSSGVVILMALISFLRLQRIDVERNHKFNNYFQEFCILGFSKNIYLFYIQSDLKIII